MTCPFGQRIKSYDGTGEPVESCIKKVCWSNREEKGSVGRGGAKNKKRLSNAQGSARKDSSLLKELSQFSNEAALASKFTTLAVG